MPKVAAKQSNVRNALPDSEDNPKSIVVDVAMPNGTTEHSYQDFEEDEDEIKTAMKTKKAPATKTNTSAKRDASSDGTCGEATANGSPCGNRPVLGSNYCRHHGGGGLKKKTTSQSKAAGMTGVIGTKCQGKKKDGNKCGRPPSANSKFCAWHE